MKERGFGGVSTQTGLVFERHVDFRELLRSKTGYEVKNVPGKAGKGVYFHDLPPIFSANRNDRISTAMQRFTAGRKTTGAWA